MSLLERMRKDSQKIINSQSFGMSDQVTITTPEGVNYSFLAIVSIIRNLIDPDTGQPVSGFLATASINTLDLHEKDVDIPEGEMSETARPWVVSFLNIHGVTQEMKIVRASPDETNGNILLDLGAYER